MSNVWSTSDSVSFSLDMSDRLIRKLRMDIRKKDKEIKHLKSFVKDALSRSPRTPAPLPPPVLPKRLEPTTPPERTVARNASPKRGKSAKLFHVPNFSLDDGVDGRTWALQYYGESNNSDTESDEAREIGPLSSNKCETLY